MSEGPQERKKCPQRCTAMRRDGGGRCRAWARRGVDGYPLYDPPLCTWHAPEEGGAEEEQPEPNLPAPAVEQGVVIEPGSGRAFYAPFFDAAELAALSAIRRPSSLQGEIMLARGLMRWLLVDAQMQGSLTGHALERRTARLLKAAETLARLLQTEHQLEKGADGVPLPMAEVLDELSDEWGIDL